MGIIDVIKSAFTRKPVRDYSLLRPTELDVWTRGTADIGKVPTLPFIGFRFVLEIYMYSDLLKTIIRSLVQETFRKGITVVPRFVVKCNICGTEYQTQVHVCEICGSTSLRKPNPYEAEWLKKFMHDVNYNDQSLLEVLQDVDTDLNIFDNAYLAVIKKYDFNEAGEVVGAEVMEVLRANPEYVMLIMDREGRPARTDTGEVVLFCLEHRDRYVTVAPEKVGDVRCNICGKKLYPGYFMVRKWKEGGSILYTNGEILHIKKFTHGLGYGLSPIFAVWMKVLTLLKQDFFILTAYHLERTPRGLLILRGNMESIQKAWRRLQEEAKTNPHIIYPLVIEGADKVNRIAEWLDLSFSAKDIDFIQYREEVRRTVGALWGVMPLFHGDTAAGAGLANEGLQIVVTNRAVEREQTLFNEKVLYWLSNQLGCMDWKYELIPNEGRDVVARIQRETMRIANAERMARLGYRPIAVETDDGIDFNYEYEGEPIERGEAGYISSKTYQAVDTGKLQRFEGEPEHGRPRVDEQRFEGEELARRPKTFIVGEGGELIPEGGENVVEKQITRLVPEQYRRYVNPEQVPKLPPGTRVYEGPRGGLFIDIRDVPERARRELGVEEEEVGRPKREEREVERPEERRLTPEERERARERIREREERLEIERPEERAVRVKRYSGALGVGDVEYEASVDEEADRVSLALKRGDTRIVLGIDLKYGKLEIEDLRGILTPEMGEALRDFLDSLDNSESLPHSIDVGGEYYKRMWSNRGEQFVRYVENLMVKWGEPQSFASLGRLNIGKHANNPDEFLGKKIFLWKEKSEDTKHIFLYLDGVQREAERLVFERNIDLLKKHFSDKYGGVTIFVPLGTLKKLGGFYSNEVYTVIQNLSVSTIFHEYLHYIFHLYDNLLKTKRLLSGLLDRIFRIALKNLGEGTIAKLEGKYPKSKESEVVLRRHYWSLGFEDVMEEYLLKTDFEKVRGIDEMEAHFLNKLKEYVLGYRQALRYMGGEKALSMFEKLIKLFLKSDGLTDYSEDFWTKDHEFKLTEAFASIGDYIGDFIKMYGDKVAFTKQNLLDYYDKIPDKVSVVHYRKNREELKDVLKQAIEFLEKIGLIKWESGER